VFSVKNDFRFNSLISKKSYCLALLESLSRTRKSIVSPLPSSYFISIWAKH